MRLNATCSTSGFVALSADQRRVDAGAKDGVGSRANPQNGIAEDSTLGLIQQRTRSAEENALHAGYRRLRPRIEQVEPTALEPEDHAVALADGDIRLGVHGEAGACRGQKLRSPSGAPNAARCRSRLY